MKQTKRTGSSLFSPQYMVRDILISLFLLAGATAISFGFFHVVPENSANIALIYISAVVLTARLTNGYLYGIVASLVSVVAINYLFTFPFFAVNFTLTGYPVTFIVTLLISISVSTLTTRIKEQADTLIEREKFLMEAEKEKMRANLLRSISHDLRSPLTGIIGNSTAYIDNAESLSDTEKLELVKHIREDSNWLLNMVENLLSVTRISANSMKIATSMESVEEVVSEAISRLRKRLPDAAIKVQVPEEFLMLPMDAMLIEQVIINLLENAIVHSKSTLPVELTVTADPRQASFHVKDCGIGISPDKLDSIFDGSCYDPDSSSDGHRGMGIGLSICKTIITAHNGEINAINHENGCEFIFTLPRNEETKA